MKDDLKWLAENVEWPEGDAKRIGLDPDGEVRFTPGGGEVLRFLPRRASHWIN